MWGEIETTGSQLNGLWGNFCSSSSVIFRTQKCFYIPVQRYDEWLSSARESSEWDSKKWLLGFCWHSSRKAFLYWGVFSCIRCSGSILLFFSTSIFLKQLMVWKKHRIASQNCDVSCSEEKDTLTSFWIFPLMWVHAPCKIYIWITLKL